MIDEEGVWRRFGPPLYWNDAVRFARSRGVEEVCLSSRESVRVCGVDWGRLALERKFSLQAVLDVGGRDFDASPRMLMARGVVLGSLRVETSCPTDVLGNVLSYMTCVNQAHAFLTSAGLRVHRRIGPLGAYVARYAVPYPLAVQYQRL